MTDKETYTPLEKSEFWKSLIATTERFWVFSPTRLYGIELAAFTYSSGYDWINGRLDDMGARRTSDKPFKTAEPGEKIPPEENPLFALIPEVPQDQFLKELPAKASDAPEERVKCKGFDRPVTADTNACCLPYNIDVHYLSAITLMLKHLYLHPDRLSAEKDRDEQKNLIRNALNTGLEIISRRGIEVNFAKSCAELRDKIPYLTTFQSNYVQQQDRRYRQDVKDQKERDSWPLEKREQGLKNMKAELKRIEKVLGISHD